ncbi:MAG: hypothetical protein Ct9H300mP2_0490 [Candidatus Neomarinimicrobiota bacterium]|nr:MAG: hypothetical protein Ct9H300mP2_0490 [Candidatus Neomarinimicrobiota bacterium]
MNLISKVTFQDNRYAGCFILESLAQTTAFLMLHELEDPLKKNMFISGLDKVRFRQNTPGDNYFFISDY